MSQDLPRPPQFRRPSKPAPINTVQADAFSPPCTPETDSDEGTVEPHFNVLDIVYVFVIVVVVVTRHFWWRRDYAREGLQWLDCQFSFYPEDQSKVLYSRAVMGKPLPSQRLVNFLPGY